MGTDIHIEVFAKRKILTGDRIPNWNIYEILRIPPPPEWLWAEEEDLGWCYNWVGWPCQRSYVSFGRMCRNARGGDGRTGPMKRGLPDFISSKFNQETGQDEFCLTSPDGITIGNGLDLGEHTFSWLTLNELREIDWEFKDEEENEVYQLWPKRLLIPLLERIERFGNVEEVIVVFGFDS